MPPTVDVEKAVHEVMEPFREKDYDEENYTRHYFFDWYKIGGRFTEEGCSPVRKLAEVPKDLSCFRFIVALQSKQTFQAIFMIEREFYNGVNLVDAAWDGNFFSAIDIYQEIIKDYKEEWKKENTPKEDWLVVMVDYHI